MIILKYGNARSLYKQNRWKDKCSDCGGKVIIEKEDVTDLNQYIDISGDAWIKFHWECPYCQKDQTYKKPNSCRSYIRDFLDNLLDTISKFVDYHLFLSIILSVIFVLALVFGGIAVKNHYKNTHYAYRIEWTDYDQETHTTWVNEYDAQNGFVIFINNGAPIKIDQDLVDIIDLKEEG